MASLGLLTALVLVVMMVVFIGVSRQWPVVLRPLPGYRALAQAIERSVEAGERVHVSLGTKGLTGTESAPVFAGLTVLAKIAGDSAMSDKPVVVSAADGAVTVLAQDTLRASYKRVDAADRFLPTSARFLGPTPFSYVVGLPSALEEGAVSVNVLNGSFGQEAALAAEIAGRGERFVLAGSDDLQAQALFYAAAEYPLVGEEIYAGGAYLDVHPIHTASLRAQDMLRWAALAAILLGTLLRTAGIWR